LNLGDPAELYSSSRPYQGLSEPHYPFHYKTIVVTHCGRLCLHRKKINLSACLAGQAVGIQEVDDGIWLVSFMDYDLGYADLGEPVFFRRLPICGWIKLPRSRQTFGPGHGRGAERA
jgi:hypothetical protein